MNEATAVAPMADSAGNTPPPPKVTVEDAVAKLIGAKPSEIKDMSVTAGERRLEVEGVKLGLKQEMPVCSDALLRVGRHVWKASWDGTTGKAEQLTIPGT